MSTSGSKVSLDMAGSTTAHGTWKRTITMDADRTTLVIRDRLSGKAARHPAVQNFPLDPVWKPSGRSDTYITDDGLSLVIECTTAQGFRVPVQRSLVMDYQRAAPRRAYTARCQAPRGVLGVQTVLTVMG
jgi:hypothetical protein